MVKRALAIRTRTLRFITLTLAGLVVVSSAWVFPNFETAQIRWADGSTEIDQWPWITGGDAQRGRFFLKTSVNLSFLHPRKFLIVADDELREVEVNGQTVGNAGMPIKFDQFHPALLDLGSGLRLGANEINFEMANLDGPAGLRIHVHPLDPLCLAWTVALISLAGSGTLLLSRAHPGTLGGWCGGVLFTGIALRILYWVATPYYLRAYDWGGHLQFLRYVAEHLALPPADHGWETHQPPLYYMLGGLWMRLTGQTTCSWLYGQWSAFALVLSVSSLVVGTLIGQKLFPNRMEPRVSFLAILACFPALVFYSARISNDTLFAFLSLLWLWLLLKWWESPSWRTWFLVVGCVGVAFLVKNGALVLAGATVLCAAIRLRSIIPTVKAVSILASAVVLFSGWYQIPRALSASDPSSFVIGKYHLLEEELRVGGSLPNMLIFNPIAVLQIPFNHPWIDDYRRQFFPEYFFKSALFGEWAWGRHLLFPARLLVLAAFILMIVAVLGLLTAIRDRYWASWPLVIASASMVAAQAAYVMKEPFSCNQDFRFFVALTIPLAAFAALGASRLPGGNLVIALFCAASASFLIPLLYA